MKYLKAYSVVILGLFVAGGDYIDAAFVLPVVLALWANKAQVLKKATDK